MSYCRQGWDSDAHVVRGVDGRLACLACRISGSRGVFECRSNGRMIEHLEAHRAAGQRVPDGALERLYRELTEAAGGSD